MDMNTEVAPGLPPDDTELEEDEVDEEAELNFIADMHFGVNQWLWLNADRIATALNDAAAVRIPLQDLLDVIDAVHASIIRDAELITEVYNRERENFIAELRESRLQDDDDEPI